VRGDLRAGCDGEAEAREPVGDWGRASGGEKKNLYSHFSVSEALIGGIGDSHYRRWAYAWLERRICWDTYATLLGKMTYLGNADGGRLE
jgi:hypothetical protein